jgi:hypothetical protein
MERVGTISCLIRYPVKSMLGETLPGAAVTQWLATQYQAASASAKWAMWSSCAFTKAGRAVARAT